MDSDPNAAPINPLPAGVIILALPIVLAELAFAAGANGYFGGPDAVGWRLAAIQKFAFFGPLFDEMIGTGRWPPEHLLRFLTYPFVHWGFTHMLMVLVFLLALGKMVGDVFGSLSLIAIFFGSAMLGALAFALITNDPNPLVGGYPAVYGLIGAYTFILWVRIGVMGGPQYQAFSLIAVLLAIQLVFGLLFGSGLDWIAEVAGFTAGFFLSFVVSPGGWSRVRARLRHR